MTTDVIVVDIKCGLCEILASDNHAALGRKNEVKISTNRSRGLQNLFAV